jgi:hypothetical protein
MEATQGKPAWKRRRWLIVAFVLVLVSMVSWWSWPRGDARFVGKWQWFDAETGKPEAFCYLHANGTGRNVDVDGRWTVEFSWQVEGSEFLIGRPRKGFMRLVHQYACEAILLCTGIRFYADSERHTIDDVRPDAIQLHFVESECFPQDSLKCLRRIPE